MNTKGKARYINNLLKGYSTYLPRCLGGLAISAIVTGILFAGPVLSDTLDVIPGVAGGIRTHYVSGDGTRVLFTSTGDPVGQNADGNSELFVYDVASKQIHQLTHTTSQPNFYDNSGGLPNQDATRIVFASRFNLAGGGELLLGRDLFLATVNYATTVPSVTFRRLTTGVGNAYYAYSGDGHMVGLISNFNPVGRNALRDMQMFRINLDPAPAIQQLTEVAGGIVDDLVWMGMDINFNGNCIVFTSARNLKELNAEGNQEIYYVTDTGYIGQVTQTPAGTYNREPSISSGSLVVFRSNADITGGNPDGNFELFVASDSYAAANQITDTLGGDDNFGGANKNPRFSQGADSVVFTSNRDLAGGSNADGNREIFHVRIIYNPFKIVFEQLTDTTNPHPGTRFENDYADIDDLGRVIAFNSDLNPGGLNGVLYVMQRASMTPTTPPYISSFFPGYGCPGVPVMIGGHRFTGATSVTFGTLPASSLRVISDTNIVAVVPTGVAEAPITVTTPAGSTTTSTPFRLEQLLISGEEINQGMASYPAVAGKDALVRVLVHIQNAFGAWAISDATLTITSPSGRVSTLDPRMYNMLIQNKEDSLSERNNINFFVPGNVLAESGQYTFRILAHTAGQTVVDRTITKQLTATSDVVLIIQSMMRAPDEDEYRLLLQELEHFSRMHPVRAGIGGIRLIGDTSSDNGLRIGYVFPPMFAGFNGADTLSGCVSTTTSCWGTILQQMNELREAFNALAYYEYIEFGTVAMPSDRIISPHGEVKDCSSTIIIADGFGNFQGNASWIRLCGINTTLAHEVAHNMGLIPIGAANSDGGSHSINSYLEEKPAFNLTRWEHVDSVVAAMCSALYGPDKTVFFEDEYNDQPVDYPWLVNKRHIVSEISMSAPFSLLAFNETEKHNATDVHSPLISMTRWNGPRLLISALIDEKGDIRVHNLAALPKGTYLSGHAATKGKVELVLRDIKGNVIQREFLATQSGLPGNQKKASGGEFYNVTAVRPLPENAVAVEIVYRDKVVYLLKPGSNAPLLRLKTARLLKAGKGGIDKVLLEWSGSDTDGDVLRYRIDYSRDGKGYIPLLLNVEKSDVAIPVDQLPGGKNISFRITASDGINTTMAITPRLSLPGHRPVAAITSLSEGERYLQYDTIELRGLAFDLEDGIVGGGNELDKSFTWRLDNRKVLGHGAILKTRADIAPGKHTVSLEFRDSDGDKASIHRRILIEADSDRDRRADHFEHSRPGFDAFMPFDRIKEDAVGGVTRNEGASMP